MMTKYVKPKISITVAIMENGILAGSGIVYPGNEDGTVYEEWTEGEDDNRTIDW